MGLSNVLVGAMGRAECMGRVATTTSAGAVRALCLPAVSTGRAAMASLRTLAIPVAPTVPRCRCRSSRARGRMVLTVQRLVLLLPVLQVLVALVLGILGAALSRALPVAPPARSLRCAWHARSARRPWAAAPAGLPTARQRRLRVFIPGGRRVPVGLALGGTLAAAAAGPD